MKRRVLFICVKNSARSQMAAALLNDMCAEDFEAESAGLEPGELSPLAIAVMAELDIDISRNRTRSVFDVFRSGALFSHVITVCDRVAAERCPIFPGFAKREHWSFEDPADFTGNWQERLSKTRQVRTLMEMKLRGWCREIVIA